MLVVREKSQLEFLSVCQKPLAFPGGLNFTFLSKQCLSPEKQEKNNVPHLHLVPMIRLNAALLFVFSNPKNIFGIDVSMGLVKLHLLS